MHSLLAEQIRHCKIDPATLPPEFVALIDAVDAAYLRMNATAAPANRAGAPLKAAAMATILLAEDDEINQIVASEILIKAGFQCDVVCDGRQALEISGRRAYDLILMDCQMPEMDGFEASTAIRRREAEALAAGSPARDLPIVALVAGAQAGDRERCLAAGMGEYLCKPLDPRQLIATLNRLLATMAPSEPTLRAPQTLASEIESLGRETNAGVDEELLSHLRGQVDRCIADIAQAAVPIPPTINQPK